MHGKDTEYGFCAHKNKVDLQSSYSHYGKIKSIFSKINVFKTKYREHQTTKIKEQVGQILEVNKKQWFKQQTPL